MNKRYNSEEWYVWEQNASPMLLIMTLNPSFQNLREYLGVPLFNTLVVFETDLSSNYQAKWIFRLDEGRILGQKMVDMLLCPQYMVTFNSGLEVAEERLMKKASEIQKNYTSYSLDDIASIFEEFEKLYYDYYKYAAFTEPTQWHTEYLISNYINKHYKGNVPKDEAIKALLVTETDSFTVDILRDLYSCALEVDSAIEIEPTLKSIVLESEQDTNFVQIVSNFVFESTLSSLDDLKNKLNSHSLKYYWKKNNYYSTFYVSAKNVLEELLEPSNFEFSKIANYYHGLLSTIIESKKKQLALKTEVFSSLPSYYQGVVSVANSVGSTLIDNRKKNVMSCNSAFDALFSVVAKKTKFNIEDIHLLIPQEFRYFLSNPLSYTERFTQRRELFVCLQSDFPLIDELIEPLDSSTAESVLAWKVTPTTEPYIAEGKVAEKALDKLNHCMNLFESHEASIETLHGVTAFYDQHSPVIEGIVKVIKNPNNESLSEGEILVAPSTTPDFINAISKSIAIITDWGGQTSHAAIVARELKKPCIIGTNFASQILKSGQKIRLDFAVGSIEILE
jgi:phosphohistidine swiveling domain-containing protein